LYEKYIEERANDVRDKKPCLARYHLTDTELRMAEYRFLTIDNDQSRWTSNRNCFKLKKHGLFTKKSLFFLSLLFS
jgi:hypothetical protein